MLEWLRAGYPDGVPGPDRVPLLTLLRSTDLTDDQVRGLIQKITTPGSAALADGTGEADVVAEFVADMTHYDAGPENIRRVAGTLAAAGWPLQGIDPRRLTADDDVAGRAAAG
ncbi:DUF3349 domain-containing protein [Mycobacterium heckeshornense]|nr:DUF3349 domain-containing protein [Mycobacterium heckeshornense]